MKKFISFIIGIVLITIILSLAIFAEWMVDHLLIGIILLSVVGFLVWAYNKLDPIPYSKRK